MSLPTRAIVFETAVFRAFVRSSSDGEKCTVSLGLQSVGKNR